MKGIWWNSKRFIIFQTVILKQAQNVTASHAIPWRIEKSMSAWEAGRHGMLVEDILRMGEQYLIAACREETEDHREKTHHSLVLCGKLIIVVRWITE